MFPEKWRFIHGCNRTGRQQEVAHGGKSSELIGRRRPHEDGDYQQRRYSDNGVGRPPVAEVNSHFPSLQPRSGGSFPPSDRRPTPMSELHCHWCHKLGHKKSRCPNFNNRRGPAQPVGLVAEEKEVVDDLDGYEGFISKGAVSESAESLYVPVTILRDSGAKRTLLRKGVVELPSSTFTGEFVVVRGVGGGYETVPVYRIYLRSELVTDYANVAEMGTLPFETINLGLGNDVAGKKVVPDGSEQLLDSHELSKLEKEYPEVFTACVVTRAQRKREAQKHRGVREPVEKESQECSSIDLVDTVLAQLEGPSETNIVLQKGPAADV